MIDSALADETRRRIAVMTAWLDGKEIESIIRNNPSAIWSVAITPTWAWTSFDYRVKPEPRVWEGWMDENMFTNTSFVTATKNQQTGRVRVRVVEVLQDESK